MIEYCKTTKSTALLDSADYRRVIAKNVSKLLTKRLNALVILHI